MPATKTSRWVILAILGCSLPAMFSGCRHSGQIGRQDENVIRVEGSDTMVNLAQAWAEKYHEKHPEISIQVLGGGTGVGLASLVDGNCDLANSSRKISNLEARRARVNRNGEPKEIIVGYDALAIYAHKNNPLDSISIEELADIFGEEGKTVKWSQLGVQEGDLADSDITRISRQSSSGTYTFFRDVVVGKGKDYKLGSIDQSGSKDVVALIARTPSAIGYSGMGYHTPEVKMLKVSKKKGEPGVKPTVDNARNESYPITRPLQIYVIGEPAGTIKDYLDWILGPEGQKVVLDLGYVPVSMHD